MPNSSSGTQEWEALADKARHGDRAAGLTLFEVYADNILYVLRKRLTWPLRRLVDSIDVMQDVRVDFCTHDLPPNVFDSPEFFLKYVIGMAQRQARKLHRAYVVAAKRNLHRDVPLEKSAAAHMPAPVSDVSDRLAQTDQWAELE